MSRQPCPAGEKTGVKPGLYLGDNPCGVCPQCLSWPQGGSGTAIILNEHIQIFGITPMGGTDAFDGSTANPPNWVGPKKQIYKIYTTVDTFFAGSYFVTLDYSKFGFDAAGTLHPFAYSQSTSYPSLTDFYTAALGSLASNRDNVIPPDRMFTINTSDGGTATFGVKNQSLSTSASSTTLTGTLYIEHNGVEVDFGSWSRVVTLSGLAQYTDTAAEASALSASATVSANPTTTCNNGYCHTLLAYYQTSYMARLSDGNVYDLAQMYTGGGIYNAGAGLSVGQILSVGGTLGTLQLTVYSVDGNGGATSISITQQAAFYGPTALTNGVIAVGGGLTLSVAPVALPVAITQGPYVLGINSIVSGGTGNQAGQILGGCIVVDSVDGSGAVTAAHVQQYLFGLISSSSGTFTPSGGNGASFNVSLSTYIASANGYSQGGYMIAASSTWMNYTCVSTGGAACVDNYPSYLYPFQLSCDLSQNPSTIVVPVTAEGAVDQRSETTFSPDDGPVSEIEFI